MKHSQPKTVQAAIHLEVPEYQIGQEVSVYFRDTMYMKGRCEKQSIVIDTKIGHWIKEESIHGWDGRSYQCSVCGRSIHLDKEVEDLADYPYCHCGAKMEVKHDY